MTTAFSAAPLVSCVVPVYNGARFIGDALASIRRQTHAPLEIIVVDDGSTDDTAAVVERTGSDVRYHRQSNQGPAAARNAGVALAAGAFVAFLDADDLWHTDKLARQLARFGARPELEVSFAGMHNVAVPDVDGVTTPLDAARWPAIPFSPCTLVARRSVFDRVGPFDATLRRGEDTEWFVRMMLKGVSYEVLPEILLERRVHGANLSAESPAGPQDVVAMLKVALDRRRREGW